MSLPLYAILAIIAFAVFLLWLYYKTIENAGQDIGMECEPLPFAPDTPERIRTSAMYHLHKARINAKLSIPQLAEKCGLQPENLSAFERGDCDRGREMKPMLLKVMTRDMQSPTADKPITWEIGKKVVCTDFCTDESIDCASGLYATEIEGLPYTYRKSKGHRVFEVKISGKNINFNIYKRRWSEMTPIREVFEDELRELAIAQEAICGYKLSKVIFPINPLRLPAAILTDRHIDLLKQWTAARDVAWDAVGTAARDAVWDAVWDAAWDAVWDAVWGAVRAYTLSLIPNITASLNLSADAITAISAISELWEGGVIPVLVGGEWRLITGTDRHVIYKEAVK